MKIKRVKAIFGARKVIQWQVGDEYFDWWIEAVLHALGLLLDRLGKAMVG